jgi:ATP-binding protein involved in chromosome partitioning
MAMPLEIIGLGKDQVTFVWGDDDQDIWPARMLRLRCTCAHCKSEITGEKLLVDETVPEDVTVTHMELVGNYGVAIHFSDGHTTGIYRFSALHHSAGR